MTPPYSKLTRIYSHLMKLINYRDWAKYITNVYESLDIKDGLILELAAGQGNVSKYLLAKFPGLILTDISHYMLKECPDSALLRICCDMTKLPFKKKFSFVFSTFDSINYLTEIDKLKDFFNTISDFIVPSGYFIFDVGLERNSIKYQRLLNRSGKYQGIRYFQKSEYNKIEKIHYNYFKLIFENGELFEEIHKQRIYDMEEYSAVLKDSKFKIHSCYNAFTFDRANDKTERAQFILQRTE
ncbi:MAG: hypothetical protein A2V66_09740 [Ignavibacteria bacterium RBG_13_36_8]|nr:MAG: hypothetical protein A2V66_09740 [Ignavibacteria bacterium RBG_13_36_8]